METKDALLDSLMVGQSVRETSLPSLDNSGILVQMVHRFGAGIVGVALILGGMKFKESARESDVHFGYSRTFNIATSLWLINVFVGGMYVVYAKMGDFPETIIAASSARCY